MQHITTLVVALKTVTLLLGSAITLFAFRAYRRTRARPLRALTVGFGTVTLGALVAGLVDQVLSVPQSYALIAESALTTVGFGIILYSLYAE